MDTRPRFKCRIGVSDDVLIYAVGLLIANARFAVKSSMRISVRLRQSSQLTENGARHVTIDPPGPMERHPAKEEGTDLTESVFMMLVKRKRSFRDVPGIEMAGRIVSVPLVEAK